MTEEAKIGELATIELAKIKANPAALRPVNKQSEEYEGLVASVRERGIVTPISVRLSEDEDKEQFPYMLVDGLHRHTAAIDAGLELIPCIVHNLDDCDTLEVQLVANIHKVETKPVQYAKQLQRILAFKPTMTQNELATAVGKSGSWIRDRLGLVKLTEAISKEVDEGNMTLPNAYVLAKLPEDEQVNFLERALTMQPQEFGPLVKNRVAEIRKAEREGREAGPAEFVPNPFLQKLTPIKEELENGAVGKALIAKHKPKNAAAGFALAIQWVLNMDPDSQQAQREKDAERKARDAEKAKQRKEEREKKKLADAEAKVEKIKAAQEGKADEAAK
jgi:ParB family chromosome partitioning protein